MTEVVRIDIDAPDVDMDGGGRLLHQGKPFTGEVTEHLAGALVSLDGYVDGVQHGISQEWYKNGTLRSEGRTHHSRPVGLWREWHANGRLASEQVFSEDGMTLVAEATWDEQGHQTKEWRKVAE
ncbi:toxin-antitoxin system YwqK family antitoxin [Streptomyces lichenis]|uniref:MORN repeat variant n=1 Tax=Streptomyces lichenis TaxID=2306967 RepID=A0ABT0I4J9_9ACTN|nr:hypothetical protein [Streptomyces lichenis]MCK8676268.1 hypothetical protein [Streptomyces lichenis]